MAELVVQQHFLESSLSLFKIPGDHHAFACGKAVVL